MEDCVTDTERMDLDLHSGVGAKQEGEGDGDHQHKAGGLISHLISNFVSGSVAATGEEDDGEDTRKRGIVGGDGKDEEKEGGFINHLISNLVSPLSHKPEEVDGGKVEVENGESSDGVGSKSEKGGGGLINKPMSSIFNRSDEDRGQKDDHEEEKAHVQEKDEEEDGDGRGRGGGIISNLVSHLPTSLSENAAPTTDEASMLIHSIVHD